jgi:hypothetical protein
MSSLGLSTRLRPAATPKRPFLGEDGKLVVIEVNILRWSIASFAKRLLARAYRRRGSGAALGRSPMGNML